MDNKSYNVDDILNEIKRKKSLREGDSEAITPRAGAQIQRVQGPSFRDAARPAGGSRERRGDDAPTGFRPAPQRWPHEVTAPAAREAAVERPEPPPPAPPVEREWAAPSYDDAPDYDMPARAGRQSDGGYSHPREDTRSPYSELRGLDANFGTRAGLKLDIRDDDDSFTEDYRRARERRTGGLLDIRPEGATVHHAPDGRRPLLPPDDITATRDDVFLPEFDIDMPEGGRYGTPDEVLYRDADEDGPEPIKRARVIDDFNRPADAPAIHRDLQSIKLGLFVRLFVQAIAAFTLLYLAVAETNLSMPLLTVMQPEQNMRAFLMVNLGLLMLTTIVSSTTVGGGLVALFTGKANSDSPAAVATVFSIAQGVALVVFPDRMATSGVHHYFVVIAFGLLCNTLGKLFMIFRIQNNFTVMSAEGDKQVLRTIDNRDLVRELFRSQAEEKVAFSTPAGFVTQFLEVSYTEDFLENSMKITTPLFFGFGVLATAVSYFIVRDIFVALTAFTAMLSVCAPFSATVVANLPFLRISRALHKVGGAVSGFPTLDTFEGVSGIMLDAGELFPHGSVTLHGIKVFDQKRIDEAILDAASVICEHRGILSDIFLQIVGGRESILKQVDSLVYEDAMGISAWVDGKRVLIGNRELMRHHSVDTPSRDYELRYAQGGRELLYLANSGELTAMFILAYEARPEVAEAVQSLRRRKMALSVHTVDPNMTADKLAALFDVPADMIRMMPAKLYDEYYRRTDRRDKLRGEMVYIEGVEVKIRMLRAVMLARGSILLGQVLQAIGLLAGYAIAAFFAFTGSMSALTFSTLLIYQAVWFALIVVLPSLRKY